MRFGAVGNRFCGIHNICVDPKADMDDVHVMWQSQYSLQVSNFRHFLA